MRTKAMTIEGKPVLATGANRGLGQALVEEALRRGAKRVYAGTCEPLVHPDECVAPLTLDVTDPAQVHQAAEEVGSLDVLFNNAAVTLPAELAIVPVLERHLASQSLRHVGRDRGVPTAAHADRRRRHQRRLRRRPCRRAGRSVYSISKAAAFSLSQSLRALFAGRDVSVHAVMAGPIDTDMVRDLDIPKTSPEAVARGIFEGVERGEEKIFPDPMSETMADSWHRSGQGARAPEGGAPRSRARRMSNRRGRRASSARPEARRHCLRGRPGSL
jgi:NAD(P)-dependent dehydrogenase (short-subunit alcohol dehydrogenase family)